MALGNNTDIGLAMNNASNAELEKTLLAKLMLAAADKEKVGDIMTLEADVFTEPQYRDIFKAAKKIYLSGKAPDLGTINEVLREQGKWETINVLVDCSMAAQTETLYVQYKDKLLELYQRRKGIERAQESLLRYSDLGSDIEENLRLEEETLQANKKTDYGSKYGNLMQSGSEKDLLQRMKSKLPEITTQYEFEHPITHDKEVLRLPSGAITFVCAPTSHGKSTMLQNLALNVAKQAAADEVVLYFTFEEEGDSVILQMLNKYIDTDLCRFNGNAHSTRNNIGAITDYYRTEAYRYFADASSINTFNAKKEEFMNRLYNSGKMRVYYEDYDSNELVEAVRYVCERAKVKAVFVDYIQLLNKRGNRLQRTEELKEICKDFKNLAVQTQLPIVVAAQLNRETTSPLEMHNQKIAEASDIERIANKIICLWNSSFEAQKSKDCKESLETFQARTNITLGEGGKIYAKITKNRGGVVGLEAVLDYNGNTGVIAPNCIPVAPEQTELPLPQEEDNEEFF